MKTRCSNPRTGYWENYGGRGIRVCTRWKESFEAFFADVGGIPGPGFTLERIDNAKDYEPGNVRWATRKEQNRNTRTNRMLTFGGKTQCVGAWAEETGLGGALGARLHRGWSVERALFTPKSR